MRNKILIRNPGCLYCRFYLKPFVYQGAKTREACKKGARKVFAAPLLSTKKRQWMWVDCKTVREKNGDHFCLDFQIGSIIYKTGGKVQLLLRRASTQLPPALQGEKWWQT
jgi:hypothetical protein